MHQLFGTATIASFLVLASLSAQAADLAVKVPPPADPVMNWTGFYVGANAGATWDNTWLSVVTTTAFINTPSLSPLGTTAGPAAAVASTGKFGVGTGGFIGGVQAGYNYQMGRYVVGVETDIQGIGGADGFFTATQAAPRTGFPGDFMVATVAVSERLNYLGTLRGRAGFLVQPGLLLYGTGGLAYGGVQASTSISGMPLPATGTSSFAGSGGFGATTRVGWTVGGGGEWKLTPHWSVKAEYLYYDLGSISYGTTPMTAFLATGVLNFTNVSTSSGRVNGNLARVGVNYEFGAGPILAKN